MKKAVILLFNVAVMLIFTNCKKDRTCECITTPGNQVDKVTYVKVTKRQAQANCFSYSYESSGTKIEVNCTLK